MDFLKQQLALFFVLLSVAAFCQKPLNVLEGYHDFEVANKYRIFHNYDEAIQNYEKGLAFFLQYYPASHLNIIKNYCELGKVFLTIGDLNNARLYCETAYENVQKTYPEWIIVSDCLECLGLIAEKENDFETAERYYLDALKHQEKIWGKEHLASINLYLSIAEFYLNFKKFDLAKFYLQKTSAILPLEEDKETYGNYHGKLGRWFSLQNQTDSAIANYQKGIGFYKEVFGTYHPTIAQLHLYLGDVYFYQKKDFDQGLFHYKTVKNTFRDYSAKNFEIEGYDTCRCNNILLESEVKQGKVYETKYQYSQDIKDLTSALLAYENASRKVIDAVKYYAKETYYRQQIIHEQKDIFVSCIRVADQLFQFTNQQIYQKKAFEFANDYQALALQIHRKYSQVNNTLPDSIVDLQLEWEKRLAKQRELVYNTLVEGHPDFNQHRQDLVILKNRHANFLREFRKTYRFVEDLVFSENLTDFNSVSSLLNPESLLINYIIDQQYQQLYLLSFTNTSQGFHAVSLPPNFEDEVRSLHRLIQSSLLPRADKKAQFILEGHTLFNLIFQPLKDLLAEKTHLIIIRDEFLHLLPFEVLLTSGQSGELGELDYLVKTHEVSYHYSTGLWTRKLKSEWPQGKKSVLAFAPVFEGGVSPSNTTRSLVQNFILEDKVYPPLSYSKDEINAIRQQIGLPQSSTILLHAEANEANLKASLQQPHQFIHLATHSFVNFEYPQFSGIACFPSQTEETEDGILFINEIENLKIQADLVILSSCESGIGQLMRGEGLLGLNRSFLIAGVPNSIFSLWKVQDQATATLMTKLYQNITRYPTYSKALQMTKKQLLHDKTTATPFIWAGFILIGQ